MRRDLITKLESSFLSAGKDTQTILRKLFMEDIQHGNELKKLLMINTPDCLSQNPSYDAIVNTTSIKDLKDGDYVKITPKIRLSEFNRVQSYLLLNFSSFIPNKENPQFRDCTVAFDVICHTDCWELDDYQTRPLAICGYIDGLLHDKKLSGIGTLQFLSAQQLLLNDSFSGYVLIYKAIHGSDDRIPGKVE